MLIDEYLKLNSYNKENKKLIDDNQELFFGIKDLKFFKIELFIWIAFFVSSLAVLFPYFNFIETQVFVADNGSIVGYEIIKNFKNEGYHWLSFFYERFATIKTNGLNIQNEIQYYHSNFRNIVGLFCVISFAKIFFYVRKDHNANKNEKNIYYYNSGVKTSVISFCFFLSIFSGTYFYQDYLYSNFSYGFICFGIVFCVYTFLFFIINKENADPDIIFDLSKYDLIHQKILDHEDNTKKLNNIENEIINSPIALFEAMELYKKCKKDDEYMTSLLIKELFKKSDKIKKEKREEEKVIEYFESIIERKKQKEIILSIENV